MTASVIALDVGGTMIKGALVGRGGAALHWQRWPTQREGGPAAVVDRILSVASELAEIARTELGAPSLAVGAAVPGAVEEGAGVARYSANLGWRDVPLRALLSERLNLPTAVGHDVRAAGLAEGRWGAVKGSKDYLMVTLGTGIGGAVVAGGQLQVGAHALGGEIGHVVVRRDGPVCGCGARGCAEALASGSAIANHYRLAAGDGEEVSAEGVAARAAAGDPLAQVVWSQALEALAEALAIYVTLLDPELIVMGGGLTAAGDSLLGPLREQLATHLTFQAAPRIVQAELGSDAGCFGAALLAWEAWEGAAAVGERGATP